MRERTGWFLMVATVMMLGALLMPANRSQAFVYGKVGPGPSYPDTGMVTFIAYLSKGGDTDNQILTEDNWNCALGTNQGYFDSTYFIDWSNFTSPSAQDNDTLAILLTGMGAEAGNAGALISTIDTDLGFEELGSTTWGASSNPDTPTNLLASNVEPGIVRLTWTAAKQGTYRVYRSSQGSGRGNGASNGRYVRLAKDLPSPVYVDSTAPLATCWYIVVAEDGGDLSGHSQEVSIDAALPVVLSSFIAWGDRNMVVLEWITQSEWDNRGFYIYRRQEEDRDYRLLNQDLIPGAGNSSSTHEYTWIDRDVDNGQMYWYQLVTEDFSGRTHTYGPVSATPLEALPQTYALSQNYPNPFNPETWINYHLPQRAHVTIKIYNVTGQLVRLLVDAELPAGSYRVRWDGQDLHGGDTASGVYFCRMESGTFLTTVKMLLLK